MLNLFAFLCIFAGIKHKFVNVEKLMKMFDFGNQDVETKSKQSENTCKFSSLNTVASDFKSDTLEY